jgi:hypothetical protein
MCYIRLGASLTHKHFTWLKRLVTDKHSSLLRKFVNYGRKKFYGIGTRIKISSLACAHCREMNTFVR